MKSFALIGIAVLFLLVAGAASCELSITQDNSGKGLEAEDVDTAQLQKKDDTNTSQNLFSDFLVMVDEVESMDMAEIDNLRDSEILELGSPIQRATSQTIFFDEETLGNIESNLRRLTNNLQNLSESEHNLLSNRVEHILNEASPEENYLNVRNADDLREVLKNWASDSDTNTACSDLFNQTENYVLIGEGENFNIANYACPAGTRFVVRSGVHSGQSVLSSKNGNVWTGLRNAAMDGEESIYRAFGDGMNQNQIGFIELRNYHLHGMFSEDETSDILIRNVRFSNIAPDSSGQDYGAIQFDNTTGIIIKDSHFENVASAVRLRFSDGPLEVVNNEAVNIGRNFFQCDDCNGAGIRINDNSMVRTNAYGIAVLEDWINLFKSSGTDSDWIQINRNRADEHSLSGSGSFIMLGDAGGRFQEAVGNIGINPGQVGIGIAGGHDIKLEANLMYSAAWDSSNVAFYSAKYSESCGNHKVPGEESSSAPNRANWICGDRIDCHNPPMMNHAWADGQCGITLDEIRNNIIIDRAMTKNIWNEW